MQQLQQLQHLGVPVPCPAAAQVYMSRLGFGRFCSSKYTTEEVCVRVACGVGMEAEGVWRGCVCAGRAAGVQ